MPFRFLVVGCGSIGRRHLRNLRTLEAGQLLAYDCSPKRLAEAAKESGARPVGSMAEAFTAGVDACLICSPTALHASQALAVVSHCHLFIEKPIARTYVEAERVEQAVSSQGGICLVACNLRFHPGVIAMKEAMEAGTIGRPLSVRAEFGQYLPDWHPWEDYRQGYSARRDLGGGILLDAIHEIDLVRWLCGEYRQVQALCSRVGSLEIETEDLGLLIGQTDQGVWCEIHVDYLQRRYSRNCKIIGTEGTLLWDAAAGTTTLLRPGAAPAVLCDFSKVDVNQMYLDEMRHFIRCLAGKEEPTQGAAAAAAAVRVVECFQRL